ncbi:flavin oxidoreductase [Sphingobium sp. SCG-1]|uniref:2Fe-2S iron-sulfur cluster-binding protein n=1 Tax=Sphingobium sp. SCG-1 TaxID=2072936 RepID=UPI000CD6B3E9|nr:2Fe-2S iron-sulfur cluster-binding protein [Sphingobium sp. SCG-1]AUW59656.1 flavin oxidoreductase [Sphingobium sp. SCG-1]
MSYRISVPGEGLSFDCEEGETILDAVERAGYAIPYSCRKGVCSSCEGALLSGEAMVRGQGLKAGPAESVLLCQARPRTDLQFAPTRIRLADVIERRVLDAKVRRIDRPAPDVAVIELRLPIGMRAQFRAGQYLRVMMPDGDSRNYSMANGPHRNDSVELHIRHVPGGRFSENVLSGLAKGAVLTLELPYGEFNLSDQAGLAILIATGTGFAPIKSIVEHQIQQRGTRPLHLYWGANTAADLYMRDLAEGWAAAHDWFAFTPVVSSPDSEWAGRVGFVHRAVMTDHPDMASVEVYACGAPPMIEAARADFIEQARLPAHAFFSDAFVPSGDLALDGGPTPAAARQPA